MTYHVYMHMRSDFGKTQVLTCKKFLGPCQVDLTIVDRSTIVMSRMGEIDR
jgi:hypothetical protein